MEYTKTMHLEQTLVDAANMLKSGKISELEYNQTLRSVKKELGSELIYGAYIKSGETLMKKVIFTAQELKAVPIKH
jgi:hypothetical protein